ncbi:beta-2-microglobulin-like [Cottoperca gobio]|uniref:Beta-2-microglobulin n=1 Tax=Cottoperca gobio TaxID=56716 RepID=A0A6J2S3W3_COTGO|nr:beta-2-microglobulin-like [Cottoperca gobio]
MLKLQKKSWSNMKILFCLSALVAVSFAVDSKHSPAKVQVYSRMPAEYGYENILICYVSDFHPPDISIQLLKNGEEISNANQTDLAFEQNWHFHLTKTVAFKPISGEQYICMVTHGNTTNNYVWNPNM